MKILVLGGTGVISSQLVRIALEEHYSVTIFNRGTRGGNLTPEVEIIYGDRKNREEFARAMNGASFDVVIDMICFDKTDAEQTLAVFEQRAKQIIFISSIAAYQRPYRSYPIREDAEELLWNPDFAYGYSKAEMERYLQSKMGGSGAAITILRPSLTFGDGTANLGVLRQNRNLVRRIREGKPVVMIGEGVIPWSFTFAPDLARGIVLACGNTSTYNNSFHITNTEIVTWESLYKAIGKAVGREPNLVYIPTALLKEVFPSVCAHLYYEKVHFSVFSNEKFQRAAPDYRPGIMLEEGIKALVNWWETSEFPYDEQKDALEDKLCAAYEAFRAKLLELQI